LTLPFATGWLNEPVAFAQDGNALTIEAGPRTDFFRSPRGDEPTLNAPAFLGAVEGDFTLAARVRELGSPLPDEELHPSELIVPPSDLSLDEARTLFADGGVIPD